MSSWGLSRFRCNIPVGPDLSGADVIVHEGLALAYDDEDFSRQVRRLYRRLNLQKAGDSPFPLIEGNV